MSLRTHKNTGQSHKKCIFTSIHIKKPTPYIEITDGGDIVRVTVNGSTQKPKKAFTSHQWLEATVTVKGCTFSGQFTAEFLPVNFHQFRQQLASLLYHLENKATFEGEMGYLKLEFEAQDDEYIEIGVRACDLPDIGAELSFKMATDRPQIERLINQLDYILECYAID
jgi:hypothetical protein